MLIYCIRNKINGKCYIGQSSHYNSNKEFQESNYWGSGIYIQRSIQKYGLENFEKWVMVKDISNKKELNRYEILWIKKLNTKVPVGYNLTDGGAGIKGNKWGEKQKENKRIERKKYFKIHSAWNKGVPATKKAKIKNGNGHRGRKNSEKIKSKMKVIRHSIMYKRICKKCGIEFKSNGNRRYFCDICKNTKEKIQFKTICKICGKEFIKTSNSSKYCISCKNEDKLCQIM
jgi:group I intron endonuclease